MRRLKLFESYNINSTCEHYKIKNWTENPDGSIDVDGNVNLSFSRLSKLPLKFGKVTGHFWCAYNKLTSLEGAPSRVGREFWCYDNKLTTLEGAPREVGGNFECHSNELISLEGGPIIVGGDFDCHNNHLISLEGAPIYGGDFYFKWNPIYNISILFPGHKAFMDSLDYDYLRGTNIIKWKFQEALEEFGIELPETIEGYNYI